MSEATFREFRAGVLALAPLLIGVIPFGMIYGALALSQGLSPAAALAMSGILFAGSAQFLFCPLGGACLDDVVQRCFRHNRIDQLAAKRLGGFPQCGQGSSAIDLGLFQCGNSLGLHP